jgi:hypothetical protein
MKPSSIFDSPNAIAEQNKFGLIQNTRKALITYKFIVQKKIIYLSNSHKITLKKLLI